MPMPLTMQMVNDFTATYKRIWLCERHGEQPVQIQISGLNEKWEEVFQRRYCPFCVDAFFQRHFEPLKERKVEEDAGSEY